MKFSHLLLCIAISTVACSNDDDDNMTEPAGPKPSISLNGSNPDTLALNAQYSDPGAQAENDEGSDLSSNITVTGSINKDSVGEYSLRYTVTDAQNASSASITRIVKVRNEADYLDGIYTAKQYCGSSTNTKPDFNTTIISSVTINNKIFFSRLQPVNDTVEANIIGNSIIVSSGNSSGTNYTGGTGNITTEELSIPISTNLPDYTNCVVTIER